MVSQNNTYHENVPDFVIEFLTQREKFKDYHKIERWLKVNPDNRKLLNQLVDIWQVSICPERGEAYNENDAWQNFKKSLKISDRDLNKRYFTPGIYRFGRTIAAALIISIFLISAFLLYRHMNTQKKLFYSEFIVPYGSQSKIALPDGSSVWINAGSRVKYNNRFSVENRQIYLTGEAYFEVADSKLPFIVITQSINIKVLGTKFNVKAYPEEKFIETTVEKGMIQIYSNLVKESDAKKIILKSNQQASLSLMVHTDDIIKERVAEKQKAIGSCIQIMESGQSLTINDNLTPEIYSSWKDERWIIESEELQSLSRKLERKYNIKIVFKDESLKKYVFSGVLKDETLEQVLEAMKLTSPIGYELKNNVVSLHEKSALKSRLELNKEMN